MLEKPENPFDFWQELKRRRVLRIIPVYAAAAFVLLELFDIITEPLGLPDWTLKFVIIFLSIGFVVSIILSWIYDITAEGIKKTRPISKIIDRNEEIPVIAIKWKITTYVSFVIIAALVVMNIVNYRRVRTTIHSGHEKTIAVLPFHNLSNDSSQTYFCEGIREEIQNQLQKVNAFSIRSRTSADYYKDTDKSGPIIGKELNVNYLVEGSIGCEGDELKIWVQLIDAKKDQHIWADDYVKKKVNIFSIQSEIAQKIASELEVLLSPGEIEKIEKHPTENLAAYQAYLRGRYYAGQPHFTIQNWNLAIDNFQQAVKIDTGFAQAYAELARAHSRLRYLRQDLSKSRLNKADNAATKALQYGSDEPRVHLALGYYYLYGYRDEKQALKHLEIAEKDLPDNVEILVEKASILEPQGRWEEFVQLLTKASEVSPRDASILTELALGLWFTRRYEKALNACNRAIALAPDGNWPYIYKTFIYWSWKGPGPESREALRYVDDEHEWCLFSKYQQEVGEGHFKKALDLMSDTTKIWGVHHKMWTMPQSMMRAFIYDYMGDHERARSGFNKAREILETKVNEVPEDPRYHSALGIVYAGLGEKEKAISEGLEAVSLLPVSDDAVYGLTYVHDLAIIYTMAGAYDLAMGQIEYLLSIPSWLTPVWFEWDIRFAPARTHPGYEDLMETYAIEE